jgi:hypothetical protein
MQPQAVWMNGFIVLFSVGLTIASSTQAIAQGEGVCSQAGTGYQEVYTFEANGNSVTICQKGSQYIYVQTPKK